MVSRDYFLGAPADAGTRMSEESVILLPTTLLITGFWFFGFEGYSGAGTDRKSIHA